MTVRITNLRPPTHERRPPGLHDDAMTKLCATALDREAPQAQSAHIQSISGVTYTSKALIQSMQSALSSAHLK